MNKHNSVGEAVAFPMLWGHSQGKPLAQCRNIRRGFPEGVKYHWRRESFVCRWGHIPRGGMPIVAGGPQMRSVVLMPWGQMFGSPTCIVLEIEVISLDIGKFFQKLLPS